MQTTHLNDIHFGGRVKIDVRCEAYYRARHIVELDATFQGFTPDGDAIVQVDGESSPELRDADQVAYYGQRLSTLTKEAVNLLTK